jgi:hypothetical protein
MKCRKNSFVPVHINNFYTETKTIFSTFRSQFTPSLSSESCIYKTVISRKRLVEVYSIVVASIYVQYTVDLKVVFPPTICEVRRPDGEKSVILILRKNRPVQHTSEI